MSDENTGIIAKQFDSLLNVLGDLDGTGNKITLQNDALPTNHMVSRDLIDAVKQTDIQNNWIAKPDAQPLGVGRTTKFECTPSQKGKLVLYKVHIPFTNICVMDNVYDQRAANFIKDSLNSGSSLSDKKLLGVICICMEMNSIISDIERAVTERHAVIKECKYDKAQILDEELKTLYQKIDTVKSKLNKYMG